MGDVMILQKDYEKDIAFKVAMMAFQLVVSKAFLKSMLMQHLFGVLILPNPCTISFASMVVTYDLCAFLAQKQFGGGTTAQGLP